MVAENLIERLCGEDARYLSGSLEAQWATSSRANQDRALNGATSLIGAFLVCVVMPMIFIENLFLVPFLVVLTLCVAPIVYLKLKARSVKKLVNSNQTD